MAPKSKSNRRSANNKSGKPRAAISAYNLFFQTERQRILKSMSDASGNKRPNFKHLAKYVSAKWRDMDASEKVEYVQRAFEDKKRYARELVEWHRKEEQQEQQQHEEEPQQDNETIVPTSAEESEQREVHEPLPLFPDSPSPVLQSSPWTSSFTVPHQVVSPESSQASIVSRFSAHEQFQMSLTPLFGGDNHNTTPMVVVGSLDWVARELGQDGVTFLLRTLGGQQPCS